MKGFGGMGNMMQQAAKMQKKMQEMQETVGNKTVEATSGGGMVKVVASGKQEIKSINIEKSIVEEGDVDMIQDLVMAAVNQALAESQNMMKDEMAKIAGNMGLPNIPGLF
jgi:nucleoid-associated protein EbfC